MELFTNSEGGQRRSSRSDWLVDDQGREKISSKE